MKRSGNSIDLQVDSRNTNREPIAVIGLGCRLPGGVTDWRSFWNVLENGTDCVTETPAGRWNLKRFYAQGACLPGKTQSRWGGYIEGLDHFDPELFGISPREAACMDPQQRLLLESSFRAIEDAGKRLDQLAGQAVAVFVGISSFDYAVAGLSFKDRGVIDAYSNTGGSSSIAANRISYCLDLRGPSVAVDTACSSSLVAVHLACESLWRGESELALAGGVNALILPDFYVAFSQLGVMSPDGRCRTFDAKAAGYVRSEGAGVVLLKPLRAALCDRDPIYAVIRGTALNQDGRTPGMTVPSQSAQESLIRSACQRAGIRPDKLQYIEAHGTGTPVGDPVEAAAIGAAVGKGRSLEAACWIGSVKTNIGHLESGSGAASLIKVALALHHRRIPRNLHFHSANPAIDLAALGIRVPTETVVWESHSPRLAGINGFGYGGTNAHIIMEEAPASVAEVFSNKPSAVRVSVRSINPAQRSTGDSIAPTPPVLLPISARSPAALKQTASQLAEWLSKDGLNYHLAEVAGYLAHRRSHLDYRAAACANDHAGMIDQLQLLAGETEADSNSEVTAVQLAQGPVFVCCGQGPQWWAMGRGLLKYSPVFRTVLMRCDAEFSQYADWSLMKELERSENRSRMHLTSIAQPSIFAIQVALAAVWESWGIRPAAIVGHSVGEIAAAYLSGGLNWEDACLVAFHRGRTMDLASSQGGMLAVGLASSEVPEWIKGMESEVSIAAINGPSSLTIAGSAPAIDQLQERLESANVFCRRLTVEYAFHSPQMEPVRDSLLESIRKIRPQSTHTKLISTVTGRTIDGGQLGADYWWRNVRQTVRFAEAMACLAEDNYGLLIEIGPHPVLSYSISECFQAAGRSVRSIASMSRQQSDLHCISKSLGSLYSYGIDIHWKGFYNQPTRRLPVPAYPFQWQRLWNESLESFLSRQSAETHPLLGQRADHAQTCWHQRIDLKLQSYYSDHKVRGSIVYPAAGIIETAIAAARQVADQSQLSGNENSQSGNPQDISGSSANSICLERLKLHNPCLFVEDNACWMETHFHSSRGQITMAFRSCRVPSMATPVLSKSIDSTTSQSEEASESKLATRQFSNSSDISQMVQWIPLVTVSVNGQPEASRKQGEQLDRIIAARERCTQIFSANRLYDYCERLGLQYGQRFRGVIGGCWRAGEAVAEVHLPQSIEPDGYFLHPALLDSCFHTMIAADACFDHALDGLYLPAEIAKLEIDSSVFDSSRNNTPITRVVVHARVLRKTRKRMWCDLDISTPEGAPLLTIRGFESQRVMSPSTVKRTSDLIYGYRWQEDAEPYSNSRVTERPNNAHWILFMDEGGVGKEMGQRLRAMGEFVHEVYQANSNVPQVAWPQADAGGFFQVNPESLNEFEGLFASLATKRITGIIYLWGLDAPQNSLLTAEKLRASTVLTNVAPLYLVQAWNSVIENQQNQAGNETATVELKSAPKLCLVTRGAQAWGADREGLSDFPVTNPTTSQLNGILKENLREQVCQVAQAPLIGFGRVIISEYRWLSGKLIDLPPVVGSEITASGDLDQLLLEILEHDDEDEVMLRGGLRWLPRFLPLADQPLCAQASIELQTQLCPGSNSGIEELQYFTKSRGNLDEGQVEIEVLAAGLNFSDLMKALDLYPGINDSVVELGAECSGRISRVPSGSRWSVGDEVIAIAPGAFATHVIVNEQLVARKPFNLTHEEAAAIPIAFLTGQYALHQCARLKRGESILIHAATGGVGLAAIQLANAAGLRILATAGSVEKRNYLHRLGINHVMDSRSLAFGHQTLEFTGGVGVDAVLNSLPGEGITTGLKVLKLGGRFLEIGKRDIYNDTSLGLFPFRKNLSLFAIDLDQLFKHQPAQMGLLLQSLVQRFELGELRPLPTTVFEASQTGAAFRYMQQSKHIGKVVVQFHRKPDCIFAGSYDSIVLKSDRSYWIAGGLGGFGLELAKWMASRGAKHLVLSGRSHQLRAKAQAVVDQMIRDGVNVLVLPTDITQPDSVREALSAIDAQMPRLAGIFHTAMVLEDRLLMDLDRDTLERVLWPKVLGGWNLHEQTRDRELDLFVVFSSLSSVFGHAGQANYSAANALLDSLAHHRRLQGLPGLAVNWGHLAEVGYLAEREQLGQRLERQGVLSFSVKQAMDCLEYAIQTQSTQLSVLRMDWALWRGLGITGRVSPRFAHLLENRLSSNEITGTTSSPDQLRKLPELQRLKTVSEMLKTKIGSLLGMNPAQVREERALLEMGLDSLMAVELRNWVEAQLEVNLQVSTLMRSNSLDELTGQINAALEMSAPRISSTAASQFDSTNGMEPQSAMNPGRRQKTQLGEIEFEKTEKISSQEAAELLENLNELSSQEVSQLLSKLL